MKFIVKKRYCEQCDKLTTPYCFKKNYKKSCPYFERKEK